MSSENLLLRSMYPSGLAEVNDGIATTALARWVASAVSYLGTKRNAAMEEMWKGGCTTFLVASSLAGSADVMAPQGLTQVPKESYRNGDCEVFPFEESKWSYCSVNAGESLSRVLNDVPNSPNAGIMVFAYDEETGGKTVIHPDHLKVDEMLLVISDITEQTLPRLQDRGLVTGLNVIRKHTSVQMAEDLGYQGEEAQVVARMIDFVNANRLGRAYWSGHITFEPGEVVYAPASGLRVLVPEAPVVATENSLSGSPPTPTVPAGSNAETSAVGPTMQPDRVGEQANESETEKSEWRLALPICGGAVLFAVIMIGFLGYAARSKL